MTGRTETPGPGGIEVRMVETRDQMRGAWSLRQEVFVGEQGVPPELEYDDADTAPTTRHVVALAPPGLDVVDDPAPEPEVVGTGRLVWDGPGKARIGRMAVARSHRRRGVGRLIVIELERIASRAAAGSAVDVHLSAQEYAVPFYESLGYRLEDAAPYLDAGIRHRGMDKTLPPQEPARS